SPTSPTGETSPSLFTGRVDPASVEFGVGQNKLRQLEWEHNARTKCNLSASWDLTALICNRIKSNA
ncbi:MAG TPA: hypothetical protein VKA27_05040, partial [Sunxiuqinia sp.]|nr:hypothetical protein [Sunxiuqinia sp.]